MKIKSFHVQNYKSFKDSGVVPLGEHFTVVVGQNSAGKTALLERLALSMLRNIPHRSSEQGAFHVRSEQSRTDYCFEISGTELKWLLLRRGAGLDLPVPGEIIDRGFPHAQAYVRSEYLSEKPLIFGATKLGGWGVENQEEMLCAQVQARGDRSEIDIHRLKQARKDSYKAWIADNLSDLCYVFKAERLAVATSPPQASLELFPNASNLAGALNELKGARPLLYDSFVATVRTILPVVKNVGVVTDPQDGSKSLIEIWNEEPQEAPNSDLGHRLDDCGTGVGQVLALLFVVMTSDFPRLIVIDEPNSFLHPSAVRALIRTLKRYPQHQYVIATHATEVISAAEPDLLLLVRWTDKQSKITVYAGSDVVAVKTALNEVGARLSDVFGYEAIVWVEGPVEAICFPLLRADDSKVGWVPLINTGDLEAKKPNAELAWRLYERLSHQSALLPPTLAFSLDREGRTATELADLERQSKALVKFLPRRTYENYLIHPDALCEIMPSLGGSNAVTDWIQAHGGEAKFYKGTVWNKALDDPQWLANVDAARLLAALFSECTRTKEEYRKTLHSPALTRWLLKNDATHLAELNQYVSTLLDEPQVGRTK